MKNHIGIISVTIIGATICQRNVQVINLIELTACHCANQNYKKVAILGTKQTMLGGLYQKYLHEKNIAITQLSRKTINDIDHLIKDDLICGRTNSGMQRNIEDQLLKCECDAFILGCTKLPEIFEETLANKPTIDTTKLLAKGAIDFISQ